MRVHALKRTLIISGVVTLLLLVALEIGLERYFYSGTYSYYQSAEVYWEDQHTLLLYLPDPETMWRLRPNIELSVSEWIKPYGPQPLEPRYYSWQIKTNNRGFRTPPFETDKPQGVTRILCIGDSRTLGEGLSYNSTYPARLEDALGEHVEVLNLAADGWSAYQGRVLIETVGLEYDPDVVIVCFGINDSDRAWGMSDYGRAASFDNAYTVAQNRLYRSMLFYAGARALLKVKSKLFGRTRAEGYGEGPPRLTTSEYRSELESMKDLCRRVDATFVSLILPVNPHYPWKSVSGGTPFDAYNQMALLAAEPGAMTIDLRESDLVKAPDRYYIDDMHLSEQGAAYVATQIMGRLK